VTLGAEVESKKGKYYHCETVALDRPKNWNTVALVVVVDNQTPPPLPPLHHTSSFGRGVTAGLCEPVFLILALYTRNFPS
jgi:hypothetical protein